MKIFTFEEILKVLGLSNSYQKDLISQVNSEDEEAKREIERTCWDAFWNLYSNLVELRTKDIMNSIAQGENKYKLDSGLDRQAKQLAWQDLENLLTGKTKENSQIDEIRSKLKSLSGLPSNQT